jgi:hypothetical protein
MPDANGILPIQLAVGKVIFVLFQANQNVFKIVKPSAMIPKLQD